MIVIVIQLIIVIVIVIIVIIVIVIVIVIAIVIVVIMITVIVIVIVIVIVNTSAERERRRQFSGCWDKVAPLCLRFVDDTGVCENNKLLLCKSLLCNPVAKIALHPLIFCFENPSAQESSSEADWVF